MRGERKSAFVTGASAGIGRALVLELARRGWRVAAAARRRDLLETIAKEAGTARGEVIAIPLDVSDTPSIGPAIDEAAERLGGLSAVVANAGIGHPAKASEWTADLIRKVMEVNVIGAMETLLRGRRRLREGGGVLAGVSSIGAWRSGAGAAAYNASKAAFSSFLEGIRPELRDEGITVLEINPGFVRTAMTARNGFSMPFMIGADDAARRIATAIEKRRSRLAFPVPALLMGGFLRRLPDRLFDVLSLLVTRRLAKENVLGREIVAESSELDARKSDGGLGAGHPPRF